jgi:glycosyltransferase involved in cell wall biosynthesis
MIKILYLIENINIGGASDALFFLASEFKPEGILINVYCKNNNLEVSRYNDIQINVVNGKELLHIFLSQKYDLIHWFKADGVSVFYELITELKRINKQFPIVTTVCQFQRGFTLRLTPYELKYSQKIIFIDNTAYLYSGNRYIDQNKKLMIYFGLYYKEHEINEIINYRNNSESQVIFGRGSSANKCHIEMVEWFNKIPIENKRFKIVGIGKSHKWILNEISKYQLENVIEIIPHLNNNEWLTVLNSFDIFLYQLPLNAYSSIDGTMQAAMLLGKPIVFFGPESPKELIIHGESGFVANNKFEFVKYALLLANNAELRMKIGQNAKKRLHEQFSWQNTLSGYKSVYNCVIDFETQLNKLPISFYLNYYVTKVLYFVRYKTMKLFPKTIKNNIKSKIRQFENFIVRNIIK